MAVAHSSMIPSGIFSYSLLHHTVLLVRLHIQFGDVVICDMLIHVNIIMFLLYIYLILD